MNYSSHIYYRRCRHFKGYKKINRREKINIFKELAKIYNFKKMTSNLYCKIFLYHNREKLFKNKSKTVIKKERINIQ